MIDPHILQRIISEELIRYSNRPYETDFEKFVTNGINSFIRNNPDIKTMISDFIHKHMKQIDIADVMLRIISDKQYHTAQTHNLIKVFNIFARKELIHLLFDPSTMFKRDTNKSLTYNTTTLNTLQNVLMNKDYFLLPKTVIIATLKSMQQYTRNKIESMRVCSFNTYMIGHFIESIYTNTKYYHSLESLRRGKCVNPDLNDWYYTEEDFNHYIKRIDYVISIIKWKPYKGNCFLYSTFPYMYIDYVVKLNVSEEVLVSLFHSFYDLLIRNIRDFELFRKTLLSSIESIQLIESVCNIPVGIQLLKIPIIKRIKFKGSVVTNKPIVFENDMLTKYHIIEFKTGITDIKKNMTKLILENIIIGQKTGIYRNMIIYNPRSNVLSFINSTALVSVI